MPDYTTYISQKFSRSLNEKNRIVWAVEIKPKHGWVNYGADFSPYCSNCVLQAIKSSSQDGLFDKMYDFCPMDLYSKDRKRIRRALISLLQNPHHNLMLFRNGEVILTGKRDIQGQLHESLPHDHQSIGKVAIDLLVAIFSQKNSILDQLREVQKLSILEPWVLSQLIKDLSGSSAFDLDDPYQLFKHNESDMNELLSSNVAGMRKVMSAIISATAKDCSVMITFCKILPEDQLHDQSLTTLEMDDRTKLIYSVKLIDLDGKAPSKLIKYNEKVQKAVSYLRQNPDIFGSRPSCQI